MTWNTLFPDGTKAASAMVTPGQQNTAYIKTTMNQDHFWDEDANKDGHHQFVKCPKLESGGSPDDPTLGADIDGCIYYKEKTSAESVDQQDVQPFYRDANMIMQMCAIRAMGVFTVSGGVVTMRYSHNLDSTTPVDRTAAGTYTVNFDTDMPSTAYLIEGGAITNTAVDLERMFFQYPVGTAANAKDESWFKFQTVRFRNDGSIGSVGFVARDPVECWFKVYGG